MEEIENRSRLSEKYPPMTSTLVNKLGYNGMRTWRYNIIRVSDIGKRWVTYKPYLSSSI